ncbi:hypothetical protein THOM_2887 [Trachipleistophora hominis]|uniref:Uncharacterized protein n=1 Tax=Trachipleistophora hominis TaxID=72359 RepID=L7JS21_TRAHO|nr:hypothetical protein THOM_2887 [Trachipleistophora hominis]
MVYEFEIRLRFCGNYAYLFMQMVYAQLHKRCKLIGQRKEFVNNAVMNVIVHE